MTLPLGPVDGGKMARVCASQNLRTESVESSKPVQLCMCFFDSAGQRRKQGLLMTVVRCERGPCVETVLRSFRLGRKDEKGNLWFVGGCC